MKQGVTWVCRVSMKVLFFCCYYESEFFGSQNYRCNVNGGMGLDGFLITALLRGLL